MTDQPDNRLNAPLSAHVFYSAEDQGYIATCEIPGISAFGDTPVEAVRELTVARAIALEVYHAEGWAVPQKGAGAFLSPEPMELVDRQPCPHCGAPMQGSVPARDDVSIPEKLIHADSLEDAPSGWRERGAQL